MKRALFHGMTLSLLVTGGLLAGCNPMPETGNGAVVNPGTEATATTGEIAAPAGDNSAPAAPM